MMLSSQDPSSAYQTVERRYTPSSAPESVVVEEIPERIQEPSEDAESIRYAISTRFGGSLAISAVLALCSGPLVTHAFAINSRVAFGAGIVCLVAAIAIQWSERRRAFKQLVRIALTQGCDETTANEQARATIRKWLT